MAYKVVALVFLQAVIFQTAYSQVIGRLGGCGCSNILPVAETILPQQYIQQPVIYEQPTTIIQDSTVANNLANALQLLVVSNLLSNTLPLDPCAGAVDYYPAPLAPLTSLSPLTSLASASLAPYASLSPYASLAPIASPCGCGGCGSCGCGLNPYNILF